MDRSNRTVQMPRRLLWSQALQQTEHDRISIPLWQLANLPVDHLREVITISVARRPVQKFSRPSLTVSAPRRGQPSGGCGAIRDPLKPGP